MFQVYIKESTDTQKKVSLMSLSGRVLFSFSFLLFTICMHVCGAHVSQAMCQCQRTTFQETILSFQPVLKWGPIHSPGWCYTLQASWSSGSRKPSCLHFPSCHRNAGIIDVYHPILLFLCGYQGSNSGCQAYAEETFSLHWAILWTLIRICSKKSIAGL